MNWYENFVFHRKLSRDSNFTTELYKPISDHLPIIEHWNIYFVDETPLYNRYNAQKPCRQWSALQKTLSTDANAYDLIVGTETTNFDYHVLPRSQVDYN